MAPASPSTLSTIYKMTPWPDPGKRIQRRLFLNQIKSIYCDYNKPSPKVLFHITCRFEVGQSSSAGVALLLASFIYLVWRFSYNMYK
jgi:hypothetical protein